jgi:cell division protein FtsX
MASGYIAGGAIAGIVIAFLAAGFEKTDRAITEWAMKSNRFFGGPDADLLSMLPFLALLALLALAARGRILRPR